MAHDILIVDDEADIRELVSGILGDEGYEPRTAVDARTALSAVEARLPMLVVLDIWLEGSHLDGLELLNVLKSDHPDLPVLIISGVGAGAGAAIGAATGRQRASDFDVIYRD